MNQVADVSRLEKQINYRFVDRSFINLALTHRSASKSHNERLEFLGDSLLNLIISGYLFEKYPQLTEGAMSRLRSQLVNRDTLAAIAVRFDVGNHLILGTGETKSGGHRRDSTLANTLEAIIAAVYLDANQDHTIIKEVVINWYVEILNSIDPEKIQKDPKTTLQEYLQAKGLDLPNYQVERVVGESHQQTFHVKCTLDGLSLESSATGRSRKAAEQKAAELLMEKIERQ